MIDRRSTSTRVTLTGTAGICAAAFWLSYEALTDLAHRSGVTTPWLWPLIVDGLIVVATVAVVARAGRYAWGLLIAGASVSVAGNVLHAALPDGALPVWLRATVAAVPPVALVAVTHLAVVLRRTHAKICGDALGVETTPLTEYRRDAESPQFNARDIVSREVATSPATDHSAVPAESPREELVPRRIHPLAAPVPPVMTADDDARDTQSKALALLNEGMPVCDIAAKLGVHRATVYRWRAAAS